MAHRLSKWLTTRRNLMTLAVDAYIEVRIRQTQPHLGHLSNVFAQHEMINYIFFDVTTRHIPRRGTASFLTLKH